MIDSFHTSTGAPASSWSFRCLGQALVLAIALVPMLSSEVRADLTCDVTFGMTSSVPVGSLQFDVDYSEAGGGFVGSGGNVECTKLPATGLLSRVDIEETQTLRLGLISTAGFSGSFDIAACTFSGSDVPSQSALPIQVTELSDASLNPIDPLLPVTITSVHCSTGICGDANVEPADTLADNTYAVLFRLTTDVVVANVEWKTSYTDLAGEFAGTATDPECSSVAPGLLDGHDDGESRILDLGFLSGSGVTGSVDFAVCNVQARTKPSPSDFDIQVIEAGDLNADPLFPLPSVTVAAIDCIEGACDSDLITTCPLPGIDLDAGDAFGTSLALTSDRLVVGAPGADNGAGRVHVLTASGDTFVEQTQTLPIALPFHDPGPASGSIHFGAAVDIDKNTIVVGTPQDVVPVGNTQSSGSASVFFFDGTAWTLQAKLLDASGACTHLGTDVAISGDTVVLGAPDADCALVFERSGATWSLAATLKPQSTGVRFGLSVDVSGEYMLIGAPGAGSASGCTTQGAVHAYRRVGGTWQGDDVVTEPAETGGGACFGAAVAVDGTAGVAGAPFDNSSNIDGGAAYVLERQDDDWQITAQLLAEPSSATGDAFGSSVDIKSDVIIVGAPGVAAYVFERAPVETSGARLISSKWTQRRQYQPPATDDPQLTKFAFSVAVAPGKVAVGAPGQLAGDMVDAGAVYPDDAGLVVASICGDGNTTSDETCDDGDLVWKIGEFCNALCRALECGDPNDTGTITSGDALFALRVAVHSQTCDLAVCDVNESGSVTTADALAILKKAVRVPVTLHCK